MMPAATTPKPAPIPRQNPFRRQYTTNLHKDRMACAEEIDKEENNYDTKQYPQKRVLHFSSLQTFYARPKPSFHRFYRMTTVDAPPRLAIVTGVTGQDGSYLAELLLQKNYIVWGVVRPSSVSQPERITQLQKSPNFVLKTADLQDNFSLQKLFEDMETLTTTRVIQQIELYNLAAQSHVRHSFDMPEYTAEVDGLGVLRLLECIRKSPCLEKIRFYQASTSELFGNSGEQERDTRTLPPYSISLNEESPMQPCSPYAVAKLYAYWTVRNYRKAYKIYACNGILFNHESPRRGAEFVTRKITLGIRQIFRNGLGTMELGNLDAARDWGHARDYVEGMWRMLQHPTPDDYVLATGETHSVRDFVTNSFRVAGLPLHWEGTGVAEQGKDSFGIVRVRINPQFYRPNELHTLCGDARNAQVKLGWKPSTSFSELVAEMVHADLGTIPLPVSPLIAEFVEHDGDGMSRIFEYRPESSCEFQTAHQNVKILDTVTFGKTLFLNGVLQSSVRDEALYHTALVSQVFPLATGYRPQPVSHRSIRSVYILGGGEGATAREVLKQKCVSRVTMIDWDEELVQYFKKHCPEWHQGAFADSRLSLRHDDVFAKSSVPIEPHDAVLVDLVDPELSNPRWTTLLKSLATEWIAPGGILVVNAGGVYPWDMSAITAIETVLSPFGTVSHSTVFVPSFGKEWGFVKCITHVPHGSCNIPAHPKN